MKTIHALLFAINNYPNPEHRLAGCLNDQKAIHDYLQKFCAREGYAYRPQILTDADVTRQGFINGFKHFEAAKNGDVAVMFYGGHGSRVRAPREFWGTDPDRYLETIVCHDSRDPGGQDLTDKELGRLIRESTNDKKLHFVAILDCCHSGTMSRSLDAVSRRIEPRMQVPGIESLYGSRELLSRGAGGEPGSETGSHIALSAARAYETSNELTLRGARRGLFTTKLVETLIEAGASPINYETLMQRVKLRVTNRLEGQHPQLDAYDGFDSLSPFLDMAPKAEGTVISYDPDRGWVLPFGSVHQVEPGGAVHLIDPEGGTREAEIDDVRATYSTLKLMKWADESPTYRILSFAQKTPKVAIAANPDLLAADPNAAKLLKQADWPDQSIEWSKDAGGAEYWVNVDKDFGAVLTRPGEERPLFHTDYGNETGNWANHLQRFVHNVDKVASWERISRWSNPLGQFDPEEFIEIHFSALEGDEPARALPLHEEAQLSYVLNEDKTWTGPAFRLSVANKIKDKPIWVGALYLSEDFGITEEFFPMREIGPEDEPHHFAFGKESDNDGLTTIQLVLPDEIHSWGQTSIFNRIKLVISTGEIDLSGFRQDPLNLQAKPKTRGIFDFLTKKESEEPEWATLDLDLRIHRPVEGEALTADRSVKLQQVTLEAPVGFQAGKIRLSSSRAASRGFGAPVPAPLGDGVHMFPMDVSGTRSLGDPLDVVELYDVEGEDAISADNPLQLQLAQSPGPGRSVVPLGYDHEDGFYMPLGYTAIDGKVRLEALPEGEPSTSRGLGNSLKIYLQQVIHTKIRKKEAPYPILAAADVPDDDTLIYEVSAQAISVRVAAAQTILILVHGLIGETSDKGKILRRAKRTTAEGEQNLGSVYDLELCFDYESLNTPIEDNARALRKKLAEVGLEEGHGKKVVLVAHSMGGLVSRWFLEREGGNKVISHFVIVGTPNLGSPWVRTYDWATFALGKAINFLPLPGFINEVLGLLGKAREQIEQSSKQMIPDSPFLRNLNSNPPEPGIPYFVLGGDSEQIIDPGGRQEKFLKKYITRFRGATRDKLDQWLFKGDHDDIVGLNSIYGVPDFKSPGVEKLPPVGCHHFSYFIEPVSVEALGGLLFRIAEEET